MRGSAESPFKNALITGGAGFVGSHLTRRLVRDGTGTTILDNLSSGFLGNLQPGATFVNGDVRDPEMVRSVAKGADVIFHLAEFIPNYPGHIIRYSAGSPREDLDVCVGGTINVLEEARKNDAAFVLTSTAAVYGSSPLPLREDDPLQPESPYGAAKLCAEAYVLLYGRTYGLPVTIFRLFNLYGPLQRKYLMYDCLAKMKQDPKRVELLGSGKEVRDYIFVEDAVEQLVSLIPYSKKELTPIFNVGSGVGRTTIDVVRALAHRLGLSPQFVALGDSWKGNASNLVADVSRARRQFPLVSSRFEDSLESLITWFSTESAQN
jgi:UDP-glucose 4-epimerase